MYDLCVIGGGAAGIAAAITAAKRGKSVIIIEKNAKLGRKLYATGNGRCNITNTGLIAGNDDEYRDVLFKVYNSSDDNYVDFITKGIGSSPYEDVKRFVEELGIGIREINGYIYPESLQASALVWAMVDSLDRYGVQIMLKTEVTDISTENNVFVVELDNQRVRAGRVLISCGGRSYKSLGGCVGGYELARRFSHRVVEVRPSLCGLVTHKGLKDISGVRANARARLFDKEGRLCAEESGELQILESGISGIMIFNLSSRCGQLINASKKPFVCVDFIPDRRVEEIVHNINNNRHRTVLGNMNAYVNDRLAMHIITEEGINPKMMTDSLDDNGLRKLVQKFKEYRFDIKGLRDFESSQVCAGGVDISELDNSFMSRLVDGLYFAGEVIDIDGICGGYNITFAILSGKKVGLSV